MRRREFIAGAMASFVTALPSPGDAAGTLPMPAHGLHFNVPATVWDEALPLGNGMLGALLWGDGNPLHISLDRADLWDLRPVPEFHSAEYSFEQMRRWHEDRRVADLRRLYEAPYERPAPTKIPAGRIEITLTQTPVFRSTDLSLADATASMSFASGDRVEVYVHATQPVGIIRIRTGAEVVARLVVPPFAGQVKTAASGGIAAGDLAQLGYPAPVKSAGDGWLAYTQAGAEGFRFAVLVCWRKAEGLWTAAWSVASSFAGGDPLAIARQCSEQALARGYEDTKESHRTWWRHYWSRSSVRVSNPTLEKQWYLDQYKFGSASRRGAPPISLQGVWTADNGGLPPWKGDYHHDLNTELCYWPCYSANHLEEGLSYLDWLWNTRDTAFDWTQRFYGLSGLNVPMTADLRGNQIGGWVQYTHSATTAAWLAHHFYLHWKYSADRVFLLERAYPYLRSAAEFIEAFTAHKDKDGYRTHPLSASPEINDNRQDAWFPSVTNYDLALERWLMSAAAELAGEIGLDQEAKHWRATLAEFRDFSVGDDGRLLVAKDYPLKESHRHFSHLMAIHPLGLIDPEDGTAARRIVAASLADLDRLGSAWWCGYSFAWLASMAARARDGERAARALEIFTTAFTLRNSFHANGDQSAKGYSKFTYRPFTLEGNFAAAAGLQEMLLQSHRGTLRIFPAIPASWKDISFSSLRAQGAFLVSAERVGGVVTRVEIVAEGGGQCRLVSPFDGNVIAFPLRKGEKRVFTRA